VEKTNAMERGTWNLPAAFPSFSMAFAKADFQRGAKAIVDGKRLAALLLNLILSFRTQRLSVSRKASRELT